MAKIHVVSGRVDCPESQHLAACLERYFVADGCELVGSQEEADLLVLNGCERIVETPEVVERYRQLARARPDRKVLVVGCVPPGSPAEGGLPNFFVVPFSKLVRDPSLIGPAMGFSRPFALLPKDDVFFGRFPIEERYPGDPPPGEVALLAIGTGCRGQCSFCSIRRGRGASRSAPLDEVVAEARAAVAAGRFRFVLLADDAGCWGHDLGLALPSLLAELVALTPRARFLVRPMNPEHLPALMDGLAPFLARLDYLYLPLQSGSDRILSLMRRGYRMAEVRDAIRRLREASPGIVLKTDIIAGFPSESRADFRASLRAARLFDHASFHRFVAYPGTPAARLEGAVAAAELDLRIEVARRRGFTIVDPSTYGYDDGAAAGRGRAPTKVYSVSANGECVNNVYLGISLERFFQADSCTWVGSQEEADVVVLNVCNVMAETPALVERYRAFARERPRKQVLVVGCVPGGLADAPPQPNFHVIGFGQLVRDPSLIGPAQGFRQAFSLPRAQDALAGRVPSGRLPFPLDESCFVTIGSGCEGRCTYCSIRRARGAARSVDPEEIVRDARAGLEGGRFRLVLVADDAGCWGHDRGLDLVHLLGRLDEACPGARFAILDFNPVHLPGLFERLRPFLPRIDYLYLPLQAGGDRVLRAMRRGYGLADVLPLLRRIRQEAPGIVLETDFIVGFPGETPEDFEESLRAAELFQIAAFVPFVPKEDTPAATLPGRIDRAELARRMAEVRRHGHKAIDPDVPLADGGLVGIAPAPPPAPRARRTARPAGASVLVRPPQPCLSPYHAVNVTRGCALECLFCDQAFAGRRQGGEVEPRPDLAGELARELDVREEPPRLVLFSPDCEPFAPGERIVEAVHGAMALLLGRGVQVLVETRAAVPPRFLDLFARHADRVKVQLGLSTVDDRARAMLEPRGARVSERLASLAALVERGVPTEVGIGPLVPELDDTDEALRALCTAIARSGVRAGTASYLEVTDHNLPRLEPLALGAWSFAGMAARLYAPAAGAAGPRRATGDYRERSFGRLASVARELGVELALCRCNNPDRAFPAPDHGLAGARRAGRPGPGHGTPPGRAALPIAPEPPSCEPPFTRADRALLQPLLERLAASPRVQVVSTGEGLVLDFADEHAAGRRGRVLIHPWRADRPCYEQVGTLALSYSGELTKTKAQVVASLRRWLAPPRGGGGART